MKLVCSFYHRNNLLFPASWFSLFFFHKLVDTAVLWEFSQVQRLLTYGETLWMLRRLRQHGHVRHLFVILQKNWSHLSQKNEDSWHEYFNAVIGCGKAVKCWKIRIYYKGQLGYRKQKIRLIFRLKARLIFRSSNLSVDEKLIRVKFPFIVTVVEIKVTDVKKYQHRSTISNDWIEYSSRGGSAHGEASTHRWRSLCHDS